MSKNRTNSGHFSPYSFLHNQQIGLLLYDKVVYKNFKIFIQI